MGRGRSSSRPPAAPALLLLLLVCFSHGAAAARLLPLQPAVVRPLVLHQAEKGATAAAADGGLVLQEGEAAGNGDELSISEMMGAEEEAAAVCEGENDECLERRLLGDAHLDYIYTQHKGKP
ncbi:phytosulfokines 5-like [Miscanthus floridulus]|uniref:phytosulfokines 5-like n=1 Tax=Miscanthus floridulus TaxID=154761 RepID=UPI00345756BA